MALKVKAKERLQKVGKYAGTYRYAYNKKPHRRRGCD